MREASPRLGRGLAALLGEAVPSRSLQMAQGVGDIETSRLDVNPFQPRHTLTPESLTELTASIVSQGVLQPLLVRPHPTNSNRYQIIAGERRWRAAQQAGLNTVPCHVRVMDDQTVTAAALVENLQRKDLNPIEEAQGYRRLISEFGLTQEELASVIAKSRSHVANLLRLLNLPGSVQAHLQDGTLTAGHARAALAAADPAAAAEQMIAKGMSVRQAEALTSPRQPEAHGSKATARIAASPSKADADLRAVEADLSETLGLNVSISFDGRGGNVTLRYQSLDQLDHIIAKLGAP